MMTRIITGACLTAFLAFALIMGGWVFSTLFMLFQAVAMYEMYRAMGAAGHRPVQWPSWLCMAISIPVFLLYKSVSPLLPLLTGASMLIAAMVMFRSEPRLEDICFSCLPLICVLLPGMCMVGLQNAPGRANQLMLTLMAFGVPLAGDTMAYFIGSRYGVRRLCPAVSPNKSLEGAAAGLAGSMVFGVLMWAIFSIFAAMPPFWHFLVLGLLGGIAGQLGDLFASLVKRHCGIKDYGTIFPGHGGVMDRLDSVLWATAVMYVYLNLMPFAGMAA